MKKRNVVLLGFGRLGKACADALQGHATLALAGIVRRPSAEAPPISQQPPCPIVDHIRDLAAVDVALVCLPAGLVGAVARELLQAQIPIVECASLEEPALASHYANLNHAAMNHRVAAVVGAGWNPGVQQIFIQIFTLLIPQGHLTNHRHPGLQLIHSASVTALPGIKNALVGEYKEPNGMRRRTVYVELDDAAHFAQVKQTIQADPLYAGEETDVFALPSLSAMEAREEQGIVLERRSTAQHGRHSSLLLEARFDPATLSAQIMLDAARRIQLMSPGAHRYTLGI